MFKVRTVTAKPTWTPDLLARTFVGYRQSSPGARIICSALGNETPRHEGPACNRLDCKTPNPAHSKQQHFVKLPHCRASWGKKLTHAPQTQVPHSVSCAVHRLPPQVGATGHEAALPTGTKPAALPHLQMGWCGVKLIRGLVFFSIVSNPTLIQNKLKHWVSPKAPNNSWFLILCPLLHALLMCLPSLVLHLEQRLQIAPSAAQYSLSHKEGSESSSWESILAIHHCLFSGKTVQLCNINSFKAFGTSVQFKIW